MVLSSQFVEDFAGFKDPAGEPEIRFRRGWIPARMVVNQDERISAEGRLGFLAVRPTRALSSPRFVVPE
jgi:hypothetical protein